LDPEMFTGNGFIPDLNVIVGQAPDIGGIAAESI